MSAPTTLTGFEHVGLFYRGLDDYVSGLSGFVRDGLAIGAAVAVAVPAPRLALLRDRLGPGVAARVSWLDMTVAGRNPGRIIPEVLYATMERHAGRRVHIVDELTWPDRTEVEYPACGAHEALVNHAFGTRDATILCPYDAEHLDPAVLADAHRTHPALVEGDRRWASDRYRPDAVAGFNLPLPPPPTDAAVITFGQTHELATVRAFAADEAQAAGVVGDRAAELLVAVNELATNTLVHTSGPGSLAAWTEPGLLVLQLHDTGDLRDPLAGRIPPTDPVEHGRGLLLVNAFCDLVRIHSDRDGTTVRLHIALPDASSTVRSPWPAGPGRTGQLSRSANGHVPQR
ncbi:MAG: anti-sigma factor RsbA family regulatory protein [Actinocatenispora sp.]